MNAILLLILYFYWIRKSIFDAANKTKIIIERHSDEEFSLCFGRSWFYDCLPAFEPTGNQRYADWYNLFL